MKAKFSRARRRDKHGSSYQSQAATICDPGWLWWNGEPVQTGILYFAVGVHADRLRNPRPE